MAATTKRKSNVELKPSKKVKPDTKSKGKSKPRIEPSSGEESEEEDVSLSNESDDALDEVDEDSGAYTGGQQLEDLDDDLEEEDELEYPDETQDGAQPQDSAPRNPSEANLKRQEQKKLQKERKLRKAHGEEIEQTKKIWERLREKQGVSKSERTKLVSEIVKLVDGNWKDLIFRHDASRVVQTVFKYAEKPLRQEITAALKGTYVALAKSAYGKYLLVKMMHYGTAKVRSEIIDEMHGSFRRLMGHKEGAYVLEDCYREYATAKQRRQIMREFYGSEFALFKNSGGDKANLGEIIAEQPDKKPFLLENLNKVITQAIGKGSIGFEIVHAMMLEYIRNLDHSPKSMARETFIDLIADDFVEMVHTNAGSQVASLALAISTAKERKRLLKSLRQYPMKLAKDNYGNVVMMAAFLTVDDTKLTHKAFSELESDFAEIMVDRFARRPLLMLLVGYQNTKYFGVLQQRFREINEFKKEFSKKDDDVRRLELLENFAPAINSTVIEHMSELVKENLGMQFILELLLNENSRNSAVIEAILKAFDSDSDISKSNPLTNSPFSGRVAKVLARNIPEFRDELVKIVMKYPVQWSTGEGTFAVITLLETLDKKQVAKLREVLVKHRKEIAKSDAKGRDILLDLMAGNTARN